MRSKHVIVGSGALERHIAFNNNDIPGSMTVNASKHYLTRYGVLTGKEIVIATNNDSVYLTAEILSNAGAKVTVLDTRAKVNLELNDTNFEVKFGVVPYNINGSRQIQFHVTKF